MAENVGIEKKEKKIINKNTDYCVTVKDVKGGMGVFYTNDIPVVEDDSLIIKITENKILYYNMPNVISYGLSRIRGRHTITEGADIDG
jgi:hypothetical protein